MKTNVFARTVVILLSFPATHFAQAASPSAEVLIFDGKAMPLGAGQASDPSLLNLSGQWLTLFTTIGWENTCPAANRYSYFVRQTAAVLPAGAGLNSSAGRWQVIPDGNGGYSQYITTGRPGEWDEHAIEAPKYVSGYDPTTQKAVARIYYTGWRRVAIQTDESGCPVYGYQDWKIGMAEWDPTLNAWVKYPQPVLEGINPWERMHFLMPDGTLVSYSFIGDQSVIYVPGQGNTPGLWHMYYQANTDSPSPRVITLHATSVDGVHWPSENRSILETHPPSPTATLPAGPYSIDVAIVNGKYYFFGWIPNTSDPSREGLWMVSSTTPDGHATGDFSRWTPLVYDRNGTWWHASQGQAGAHETGLFAPTLVNENGTFWLFYSGVRADPDGAWTSLGRIQLSPTIFR